MYKIIYIAVHSTRARNWKYQGAEIIVHIQIHLIKPSYHYQSSAVCDLLEHKLHCSCARFEVLQVPFTINVNVLTNVHVNSRYSSEFGPWLYDPYPPPLRPTDLLAMSVLTVADRLLIPRFIAAYPAVPLGFFPVMRRDRQILWTDHILQVNLL